MESVEQQELRSLRENGWLKEFNSFLDNFPYDKLGFLIIADWLEDHGCPKCAENWRITANELDKWIE